MLPFRETQALLCPCPPGRGPVIPGRDSGATSMDPYPPISGGKQAENN
jgi:hypothetical protein